MNDKTAVIVDNHTFAQPDTARVSHLYLELEVNFTDKKLTGKATYKIVKGPGADKIILDTRDLEIIEIWLDQTKQGIYNFGPEKPYLGQPLEIQLLPETDEITIVYKTSETAAALQWLDPEQTAGGQHPFLFTQSQAILARTWLPCQDSPSVRFTYEARIQVEANYLAVMSAQNPVSISPDGVYYFRMVYPIPSYLMALAVGKFEFAAIGPRTGVYAEPETLPAAVFEFSEMENMLQAAENLYGAYPWGRYDVLVLPPSFPFGGMENPCLTFATPTIISGDRSLTSLVAHELAHSWSGNLVTNASWNDFWLNEGFTVYFERRIMEHLYGPDYADMLKVLGYQDLQRTLLELGPNSPDTCLKLNLKDRDPDEGLTEIAYEKGNLFLLTLENVIGRTRFDEFINLYFNSFQFKSNTTENFLSFLYGFFTPEEKDLVALKVKPEAWIYKPGLPETAIIVRSTRFEKLKEETLAWQKTGDFTRLSADTWTTHEWLYFLNLIPTELDVAAMKKLDQAFKFTTTTNAEIKAAWLQMALQAGYTPAFSELEFFLIQVGRRKFVLPLYKALINSKEGKNIAVQIFKKARPNYHSITRQSIESLLR